MSMTQVSNMQAGRKTDVGAQLAVLAMTVGVGAVDPRLIEPDCREPDIEELIAFRTSSL